MNNIFVSSQAEVDQLAQRFASYQSLPAKPLKVVHDNKSYTLVASYSLEMDSIEFIKTAFLTLGTFGLAACCSEEIREDWYHMISGKVCSIYLQEQPAAAKISAPSLKALSMEKPVKHDPRIVSFEMIGNEAPYNAFTDLIHFKDQLFCCFRESILPQVGDNGTIRIITSKNDKAWSSTANLSLAGYDLRDPKLSKTPDGRLMLNMGATLWGPNGQETINSAVSFSNDGINWSPVQLITQPGQWIWRVTWNKGIAYAAAYEAGQNNQTTLSLLTSTDGIHYTPLKKLDISENPTEATLRFLPDDTMVALVRRNNGTGVIGSSLPPYQDWKWFETDSVLGGPDFLILPDQSMLASSRRTDGTKETCILAKMSLNKYEPILTFPSSGDSGYPGMIFLDGKLIVSYYSSQSGNALVYRVVIEL